MEGPLLGESASLGSWGQAQQEGRAGWGRGPWWPWPAAGAAGRRPAVGRTEAVPSPYGSWGEGGSARSCPFTGWRSWACTLPTARCAVDSFWACVTRSASAG